MLLVVHHKYLIHECRLAGGRRSGTRSSAGRQMFEVTRCSTTLGDRGSFAAAAPHVWNSLPDYVRGFTLCEDTFAKRLTS